MAINYGPVVFRLGDYFGNTVNIASRIASMAASGEILITEAVARAAERAGVPVESAGVRIARGVTEPLTLWRVVHPGAKGQRDPVCGMMVGDGAAGNVTYEGQEYWFCSAECLSKFLQEPKRYVEEAELHEPGGTPRR
jgi:YHS domain-containing protein